MSADVLRRAASLMRERAEAATPGPWEVLWNAVAYVDTVADPSDPTGQTPMQSPEKVADAASRDREHIAAADPPFMLTVADWLDHAAVSCGLNRAPYVDESHALAHAVARAYLGGDA